MYILTRLYIENRSKHIMRINHPRVPLITATGLRGHGPWASGDDQQHGGPQKGGGWDDQKRSPHWLFFFPRKKTDIFVGIGFPRKNNHMFFFFFFFGCFRFIYIGFLRKNCPAVFLFPRKKRKHHELTMVFFPENSEACRLKTLMKTAIRDERMDDEMINRTWCYQWT